MASSPSVVRIAPSQKWRREWYYLDYDAYECDHVHRDWMLYGESKTKQDYVPVKCTDCSNDVMFADFDKHMRIQLACSNKLRGCEWAELCKEHLKHLNTSADEYNWLDGCDYAKINCVYCYQCEPAERREIKGRWEKNIEGQYLELLFIMTEDARVKWYNLGLALGLEVATLDGIKYKYQNDAEKCFREMINRWLKCKHVDDKSYKAISGALMSRTVGRQRMADDIKKSVFCRNAFRTDARKLYEQADKKSKEIEKYTTEFFALTEKCEREEISVERNKEEIGELTADRDKQSEQIKYLERKYKSLRENLELDDTERDIKGFREDLDDYSQQLKQEGDQRQTIQKQLSRCYKRMDECNEQITKLKEDITQSELELEQIKDKISKCKNNIVHAIHDLKKLQEKLEDCKKSLECEKKCNIVRDDDKLQSFEVAAITATVTGSLTNIAAAALATALPVLAFGVFVGGWMLGYGAAAGVYKAFPYNMKQREVCDTYDQTISDISLAADQLRENYKICKKILETKNDIINDILKVSQ